MTIVKAAKLLESLQEAKKVGIVEEPVTIAGCELVLTNLSPEPFDEVMREVAELDDSEYVHALQLGQLSRAVVEVLGVDLRNVSFVEVEVEDPRNPGQTKEVKVRRHEWVRENLLASWGREALAVGWRKFMENMDKAEKAAAKDVHFDLTLESDEDKFRRLMAEAREASEALPPPIVEAVLKENGYMMRATQEELEEVDRRARAFAEEQRQKAEAEAAQEAAQEAQRQPPPPSSPQPETPPQPPPQPPEGQNWFCGKCGAQNLPESVFCGKCGGRNPDAGAAVIDPHAAMANRQPLNQTPAVATPPQKTIQQQPHQISAERLAQIQQERAMVEQMGAFGPDGQPVNPREQEAAELRKPSVGMDSSAIAGSVDTKPQGGINPRFKPQNGVRPPPKVPPRRT